MKKQDKKKRLSKEEQKKLQEQAKPLELEHILRSTDALTPEQLKSKNKEKEKEKIHLTGGGWTSISERKDFQASIKQPYMTHFGYEKPYYKNIYSLKDWPEEEHKQFRKRKDVAGITNRLIYGRFHKEVVQHMKRENKILFAYIRRDKYFQYLTKEGQEALDIIIDEFTRMSIGYTDWDKFELDYCTKYKIPVQAKAA